MFAEAGITPAGREIIASIERTRRFSRYIKRHAPRLSSSDDEYLFVLEKAVRIFCALDLRSVQADQRLLAQIAEAFAALKPGEPLQKLAEFIPGAKPARAPGTAIVRGLQPVSTEESLEQKSFSSLQAVKLIDPCPFRAASMASALVSAQDNDSLRPLLVFFRRIQRCCECSVTIQHLCVNIEI